MMDTSEKIQIIETLEGCDAEELHIMAPLRWMLEAEAPYLVGVPVADLRAILDAHAAKAEVHRVELRSKATMQRAWEAHTLEIMAKGNTRAAW